MGDLVDQVWASLESMEEPLPVVPVPVGPGLDVVAMWPELFEGLGLLTVQGIQNGCVANWHEGWEPNREDVADLVAVARGQMSKEDLWERAAERARSEGSPQV